MKAVIGTFFKTKNKAIKFADEKSRLTKRKVKWIIIKYNKGYLVLDESQAKKVFL